MWFLKLEVRNPNKSLIFVSVYLLKISVISDVMKKLKVLKLKNGSGHKNPGKVSKLIIAVTLNNSKKKLYKIYTTSFYFGRIY